MRYCTKRLEWLRLAACALALCLFAANACAEGIFISKAEARLGDEGYQLSANFDIKLSQMVEMALTSGVNLYFVGELSISRSRWYWIDTEVYRDEQTSKLSYNALTQQYRVTRGALFQSFTDLKQALAVVGHQVAAPVSLSLLDKNKGGYFSRLLKTGSECCMAFAQMRLDVNMLPKPLQVNALTNEDWDLKSEPFRWQIKPGVAEGQP